MNGREVSVSVTANRIRRIPSLVGLGIAAAIVVIFVILAVEHGPRAVGSWLLGNMASYPRNIQIRSGWWLAIGVGSWVGAQIAMLSSGYRLLRLAVFVIGPLLAVWVGVAWVIAFVLYAFRVWAVEVPATGLRWAVDGPAMQTWHTCAVWLLDLAGLPASIEPRSFVDGSSNHGHGTLIVLGLFNEAILACVLSTTALMTLYVIVRFSRRSHQSRLTTG